jgi:hypothetical protein
LATDGDRAPAAAAGLFTNRPLLDADSSVSDDDLTALAFPS